MKFKIASSVGGFPPPIDKSSVFEEREYIANSLVVDYMSHCSTLYKGSFFYLWYGEDGFDPKKNILSSGYDQDWEGRGILVKINIETGHFSIYTDLYGTFNVYYAFYGYGILVSDSLKEFQPEFSTPDYVSVLEFIKYGYVIGNSTLLQDVLRISANKKLVWSGKEMTLHNFDNFWISDSSISLKEAAGDIADILKEEVSDYPETQLMFSAGWDSRTIFSALLAKGKDVNCFSHGDPESRELKIANEMCRRMEIGYVIMPLIEMGFSEHLFSKMTQYRESAMFPHWNFGGEYAHENGRVLCGGTFGAVMGGHNGPIKSYKGLVKYITLLKNLVGLRAPSEIYGEMALSVAYQYLKSDDDFESWILSNDINELFKSSCVVSRSNERLLQVLRQYLDEGTTELSSIYERFVTEHSGAQYMNRQLTNPFCRHRNPFTNYKLVHYISKIPYSLRMHNKLNKYVINILAPELLNYPMAATLANASKPMIFQEFSRAVRKGVERVPITDNLLNRFTKYPHKGLGWNDFEFLRNEKFLEMVSTLHHTKMFNSENIIHVPLNNSEWAMYSYLDMICKSLTIDSVMS